MPIKIRRLEKRQKEAALAARKRRQARKTMLGETGEPRKQKVTKRSAKEVAEGKAQYKVTGGGKQKTAGPTKGKGQSFAQAFAAARKEKGAGKTFTWNGKKYSTNRADDKKTGSSMAFDKRPASSVKKVAAKSGTGKKMTDREAIEKVYGGGKTTAVTGMKPANISAAAKEKQANRGKKYAGMSGGAKKKASNRKAGMPYKGDPIKIPYR